MAVNYNFKKGVDVPNWQWLEPYPPGNSYSGSSIVYDGSRYFYTFIQRGSTSAAGTTEAYMYDTYSHGWQFIAAATNTYAGQHAVYDPIRLACWLIHGGATTTTWQFLNTGTANMTFGGQSSITPLALSGNIASPALGTGSQTGAVMAMPTEYALPYATTAGDCQGTLYTGTTATSSTSTSIIDTNQSDPIFNTGHIGCYLEYTSGTLNGTRRCISTITNAYTVVVSRAFGGTPAAGDTFKIIMPYDTASAGASGTITIANADWTANVYSNFDCEIISGTGAGQRRRIASNSTTVLTLAGSTAGNARTGNWATPPDNTSVFVIKPSSDFLYYAAGNGGTALNKIDVVASSPSWGATGVTTGAVGAGSCMQYMAEAGPFCLLLLRGGASAGYQTYNIGLNTMNTPTVYFGSETFTAGSSSILVPSKKRLFITKEATTRMHMLQVNTGFLMPAPTIPYVNPTAYEGKRLAYVKSPDGAEFLYVLRSGAQEFFRLPLEWF